jgi:hypothetical protein
MKNDYLSKFKMKGSLEINFVNIDSDISNKLEKKILKIEKTLDLFFNFVD